jgi:hypothetical protein
MTTFTTTVLAMYTLPQVEGYTDVVVNVRYNISGTDGTYTTSLDFRNQYSLQQDASFTPYANLTQEQVVGWIPESYMASVQAAIQGQLNSMANPPVVPASQALPWAT